VKIELAEMELAYLANMIGALVPALADHRDQRKYMESLRTKIMPPRAYAEINRSDLEQLKQLIATSLTACANVLTGEADEEKKKAVNQVQLLLTGIQTKLEAA
jgi:tagatose-1,6-bisphosphate aldolase